MLRNRVKGPPVAQQERFYPESRYGGFTDIDGTVAFFARVNALVKASFTVVDFGCGRGSHVDDPVRWRRDLRVLKGKVSCVIGVDVDPTGRDNPFLDEFRQIRDTVWPIDDAGVDLIVCDNVR